jgi:hypothetical protein
LYSFIKIVFSNESNRLQFRNLLNFLGVKMPESNEMAAQVVAEEQAHVQVESVEIEVEVGLETDLTAPVIIDVPTADELEAEQSAA